jgi:DhnA family fructose-bisphosphate aldolase class Ia
MDLPGSSPGMIRRSGRLFDATSGCSVIVAMDHGMGGVPDGFRYPQQLLETTLAAQPDGVLLNAGLARRFAHLFARRDAPALVLGIDQVVHLGPHATGPSEVHWPQVAVEEALRLGADAVKAMLIMGRTDPEAYGRNLTYLSAAAESCRRWEIPLMIEPYLWGGQVPQDPAGRAAVNANGARIATELGADLLKLEYGGDPQVFQHIADAALLPIFILGGPKRPTQRETLADVVAAAEAGAVGLTIGRNVWQHADPAKMVRALRAAISRQGLDAALAQLA